MKKILTLFTLVIITNLNSQNVFEKEITGVWKIEQKLNNDTFITFSEYLRFINNEIQFFKIESGKEIIQSVLKIEFIDYLDNHFVTFDGQLVRFSNGEIWDIGFRNINNETRLIWNQKKIREGEYLSQYDHRGIIKNSENRKKAYEGEISTYYVKLK